MALQKCRECGHEVSSQARSCPNCGAFLRLKPSKIRASRHVNQKKPSRAKSFLIGCAGLIGLLVFGIILLSIIGSRSNRRESTSKQYSARGGQPRVGQERIPVKPEERFGLSEKKRKEIFKEIILAERRSTKEAREQLPLDPTESLRVGETFSLSKETPLMPELDPQGGFDDVLDAITKVKRLPPQTSIKILKVSTKRYRPWYYVEAKSPTKSLLGVGWINSIALIGQAQLDGLKRLKEQAGLQDQLYDKYKNETAKKHNLTRKQLEELSLEALKKGWPMPSLDDQPARISTARRSPRPTELRRVKHSMLGKWKPMKAANGYGAEILLQEDLSEEEIVAFVKRLAGDYDPVLIRIFTSKRAYEAEKKETYGPEYKKGYLLFYVKNGTGQGAYRGFNEIRWMQEVGKFSRKFNQKTRIQDRG